MTSSLGRHCQAAASPKGPEACSNGSRGQFGFNLEFLRHYYRGPKNPGESNYFIDLWAGQNLKAFASECHLTNNHALFVNSHGGGMITARGTQYAYYPHQSLLAPNEKSPCFSAADLAAVLGKKADGIHNILISACNADGSFTAQELRKYFVNATNIVHMPAGKLGFQPMFLQVLASPSSKIESVYENCSKDKSGKFEFIMGNAPGSKTTQLDPYIAELFKPAQRSPFRVKVAGREILAPDRPSLLTR